MDIHRFFRLPVHIVFGLTAFFHPLLTNSVNIWLLLYSRRPVNWPRSPAKRAPSPSFSCRIQYSANCYFICSLCKCHKLSFPPSLSYSASSALFATCVTNSFKYFLTPRFCHDWEEIYLRSTNSLIRLKTLFPAASFTAMAPSVAFLSTTKFFWTKQTSVNCCIKCSASPKSILSSILHFPDQATHICKNSDSRHVKQADPRSLPEVPDLNLKSA